MLLEHVISIKIKIILVFILSVQKIQCMFEFTARLNLDEPHLEGSIATCVQCLCVGRCSCEPLCQSMNEDWELFPFGAEGSTSR